MNSPDPLSIITRCLSCLDDIPNDVTRYNLDESLPEKCSLAKDNLMAVLVSYYSSIYKSK